MEFHVILWVYFSQYLSLMRTEYSHKSLNLRAPKLCSGADKQLCRNANSRHSHTAHRLRVRQTKTGRARQLFGQLIEIQPINILHRPRRLNRHLVRTRTICCCKYKFPFTKSTNSDQVQRREINQRLSALFAPLASKFFEIATGDENQILREGSKFGNALIRTCVCVRRMRNGSSSSGRWLVILLSAGAAVKTDRNKRPGK